MTCAFAVGPVSGGVFNPAVAVGITADSSDAKRLAAAFDQAARVAPDETRKVVQRGAHNIKKDAQKRISGHPHLPHYPNAITYDSAVSATGAGSPTSATSVQRGSCASTVTESREAVSTSRTSARSRRRSWRCRVDPMRPPTPVGRR